MYPCVTTISFFLLYTYAHHRALHFSLHDALPIYRSASGARRRSALSCRNNSRNSDRDVNSRYGSSTPRRSEEHTSELQSRRDLVCRLLLEKKKKNSTDRCY